MNWIMTYGARLFAVLTLLTAVWQTFGSASALHITTLILAACTVLTLFLPQIETTTPKKE